MARRRGTLSGSRAGARRGAPASAARARRDGGAAARSGVVARRARLALRCARPLRLGARLQLGWAPAPEPAAGGRACSSGAGRPRRRNMGGSHSHKPPVFDENEEGKRAEGRPPRPPHSGFGRRPPSVPPRAGASPPQPPGGGAPRGRGGRARGSSGAWNPELHSGSSREEMTWRAGPDVARAGGGGLCRRPQRAGLLRGQVPRCPPPSPGTA